MADVLPVLFVIAVGLALSLTLLAFWHSVRGLLEHVRDGAVRAPAASAARAALLREKDELLAAIRELRFEHELGKVSQADFDRLERRHRARAKEVLRELDEQIAPYRARAAALVEQALDPAAPSSALPGSAVQANEAACRQCGTGNDADALFCKKCGRSLRGEVPA